MQTVMTNRLCQVYKMDLQKIEAEENIIQIQL